MARRSSIAAALLMALLSGASLAPDTVAAEESDSQVIVACMLEHTTEQDKTIVREMMIAALKDDQPGIRKNIVLMGSFMSDLALNTCAMSFQILATPQFKDIAKLYGQRLGEGLMKDAFAKLK